MCEQNYAHTDLHTHAHTVMHTYIYMYNETQKETFSLSIRKFKCDHFFFF